MGPLASGVFAFSLLVSGLASSAVGTMAGQVIMQGFIRFSIPLMLRRLLTMLPALIVIMLGAEPTAVLVLSQVVLSFGIPFALLPLLQFTRDRQLMGELVNRPVVNVFGYGVAAVIVVLNIFLLSQTIFSR